MPNGADGHDPARAAVLARIRAATADVGADEDPTWRIEDDPDPAVAYERAPRDRDPAHPADEPTLALLAERIADYAATVTRVATDAELPDALAAALARHDARDVVIAPGVPTRWRPPGARQDDDLTREELTAADAVLTGCALAVAETGTVVLDAAPASGRRVLTLLTDLHVCVVRAADVVATVPQGVSAMHDALADGRPVTLVSGPSATSDIELERVEGVHGPRRLEVIVVGGSPRS